MDVFFWWEEAANCIIVIVVPIIVIGWKYEYIEKKVNYSKIVSIQYKIIPVHGYVSIFFKDWNKRGFIIV